MSTEGSRETPAEVVAQEWRQKISFPPNVESLQIQTSLNPSRHRVEFYLQAHERAPLEAASQALSNWLQTQSGVARVILDGAMLEPQVNMKVNSVSQGLNITLQDISQQVRSVMSEETLFELQTIAGPSPVRLRMTSPEGVQSLDELARLPIRTHQGHMVTLGDIATLSLIRKPLNLSRTAGQPSVQVTIEKNAKDAYWSNGDWQGQIQRILKQHYPDVKFVSGFYQQEQAEIETYLLMSFVLALVCMYGLMSVLLRSYWLPLIILYAVPFGLVGAVIGHWVLDISFTLYSLIGAFAVSGIVVNDNLVLLDQFEQKRKAPLFQPMMGKMAIIASVQQRARAVILTTVTTVLGMLPLVLEASIQSQFLKPMAVSLAFGISTATFVTLFLVPATLAIFHHKTPR
jgi:multidrug efflux pump subunit AcrB